MDLTIQPNRQAADLIRGKTAALPPVLSRMLPDIRYRAFTAARVTDFDVLKRLQAAIATLPEGGDWREIRQNLAGEISPFMADTPEGRQAARAQAELLLRTHGLQAYAAARYRTQQETADALPFWQYQTVGDGSVRDAHAALDGKVFRADDPFWEDHYPPWDFGCRCVVAALTEGEAERLRAADAGKPLPERRVLEGENLAEARLGSIPARDRLGEEVTIDVRAPAARAVSDADQRLAYRFRPGDLHPDLDQLRTRYDAATFRAFAEAMRASQVEALDAPGARSAWEWLYDDLRLKDRAAMIAHVDQHGTEMATVRDARTGELLKTLTGTQTAVDADGLYRAYQREGRLVRGEHVHVGASALPSPRDVLMAMHPASEAEGVHAIGWRQTLRATFNADLVEKLNAWDNELKAGKRSVEEWESFLTGLAKRGAIGLQIERVS